MTRPQRRMLTLLATTALLSIPALAGTTKDTPTKKTPPDAPGGWIVLEENFWLPLTRAPGTYFHRAHEEFLAKDYALAAVDLRQAAAHLRIQARRSTSPEHSTALYIAADRLGFLANDVEQKLVKSAARLDREFARAHAALAMHDQALATEAWNKKQTLLTGSNLNAAVFNIESAYGWANQEMGVTGFDAVADASRLADDLIAGDTKNYEVAATLDTVDAAIRTLTTVVNKLPKDEGLVMDEPEIAVAPPFEPGWVLVENDIWTDLPDSAGRHLHNAYEAFMRKHAEHAAREIHNAVFDLELQAGRATGDDRTALMDAIHDLEGLLLNDDDSRADLKLPCSRYDHAVANACYALAQHHCQMAEADWKADLKTLTGYDLKWAADNLDRGRVWAGQLGNQTIAGELNTARDLSDKLIGGTSTPESDVASQIQNLKREITALRSALVAMAS